MYTCARYMSSTAMCECLGIVHSHQACVLQQSNATASNDADATLPGVLPDQRLVVTSTGIQTDGGDSANITGASAYQRISSIEDGALGVNLNSPYKRLIRCYGLYCMVTCSWVLGFWVCMTILYGQL